MITRLVAALWLGSAFFLMVAAAASFRTAPTPAVAAELVGAMLTRWHYIALAAPLALFALERRNARVAVVSILFAALLLALIQIFVDLRIRSIRNSSTVSISELSREDPLRKRFGALHGASMLLLLLQLLAAGAVVAIGPAGPRVLALQEAPPAERPVASASDEPLPSSEEPPA